MRCSKTVFVVHFCWDLIIIKKKCNQSMRNLGSYIKDTKDFLKIIEKNNNEGFINEEISIVTADMENMCGNMPLELSNQGIIEYW